MIQLNQLKIHVKDKKSLLEHVATMLRIDKADINSISILKRSLDARKKPNIYYVYNLIIDTSKEQLIKNSKIKNVTPYIEKPMDLDFLNKQYQTNEKIAVIGFGPAGMFASLALSIAGIPVDVYERGGAVENRMQSIEDFKKHRILNKESNIQFGEGGAGTYSDGKLTNHGMKPRGKWLFKEFIEAGAPEEIMYVHNPHIGTDKLVTVVKNIRKKIERLGSSVFFDSKLTDISKINRQYHLVINGETKIYDRVILAIGHSARDTFEMLYKNQVEMEQKPFAVGFRIEHLQEMIDQSQYGNKNLHHELGAAEYKLVHHCKNRSIYTFCMCPGGYVVPAISEEGQVVVNGMSEYKRDNINSNSAVLVTVDQRDFESMHPLAGVEFQRSIERKAFLLGKENYNAPVQLVGDFIKNQPTKKLGNVLPSYEIGFTLSNLRSIFSEEINQSFIEALKQFDHKVNGFSAYDSVLTGVESRSSSPVRIVRDSDTLNSVSHPRIYPIGEGAGYAGGIVSAGLDGLKVAEVICQELDKKEV